MLGTKTASFRSRPIEIEAMRFDGRNADSIVEWLGPALCEAEKSKSSLLPVLIISTPEGSRRAKVGDWVVKAQDGGAYALEPLIFASKFEPVIEG